jgi:excinuclease ABC subunit B
VPTVSEAHAAYGAPEELPALIHRLKDEMKAAARDLEFEKAATIRDQIKVLSEMVMTLGGEVP